MQRVMKRFAIDQPGRDRRVRIRTLALILVWATLLASDVARADSEEDRRVRSGARLFRSLLTADTTLKNRVSTDGSLHVVIYGFDSPLVPEVESLIGFASDAKAPAIRDFPMKIDVASSPAALLDAEKSPAGIFLVSAQTPDDLAILIQWGQRAHAIIYSPFEGDVERGATAGLSIEAKVRPYLNTSALQAAGIQIKPFYLKVAKTYP
jgi:hypothetical protein